ncbi:hypothetical protein C2845_PM07G07330 [Panicum miliaceum]|uniref:Uncharacterized protein n=1 Tax=Panicum miliaceum TaxID=4540 RepID=A0A3L6SPS0_PANMI|nr:hypothetical protein C2845_PM07G07330 [Panicum miliaceum]
MREAFAMMGALAWQATVIKKDILVSRGGDRTGVDFVGPGFSSPFGVPVSVAFRSPLLLCATELVHHLSRRRGKNLELQIYSQGTIGNLACNFLYVLLFYATLNYVISRTSV